MSLQKIITHSSNMARIIRSTVPLPNEEVKALSAIVEACGKNGISLSVRDINLSAKRQAVVDLEIVQMTQPEKDVNSPAENHFKSMVDIVNANKLWAFNKQNS